MPTDWQSRSPSYRSGWIEARETGERDAYLLRSGCSDLEDYERGFRDGLVERQLSGNPGEFAPGKLD